MTKIEVLRKVLEFGFRDKTLKDNINIQLNKNGWSGNFTENPIIHNTLQQILEKRLDEWVALGYDTTSLEMDVYLQALDEYHDTFEIRFSNPAVDLQNALQNAIETKENLINWHADSKMIDHVNRTIRLIEEKIKSL